MSKKHDRIACPFIGISLGDTGGIGPEVTCKALRSARVREQIFPVIFGPIEVLKATYARLHIPAPSLSLLQEHQWADIAFCERKEDTLYVVDTTPENFVYALGRETHAGALAAYMALEKACEAIEKGHIDALCTAPLCKHTLRTIVPAFEGHTTYLAERFKSDVLMMMLSDTWRMALATTHIPLHKVSSHLHIDALNGVCALLFHSLKRDFGISMPKVAVLGLNPHAGEKGELGEEEKKVLLPCIAHQRKKKRLLEGPFAADGFFGASLYNKFDAVIAMYHDQGLVGFKSLAFVHGVNYTAGLPIVRTSPVHGTAFSLAEKGVAEEGSMREALSKARDIFRYRNKALHSDGTDEISQSDPPNC